MAVEVMRRTSRDLLNAVVKSLEGMADDDVMYVERLKWNLKEKDKRLKEKDKSLEEKDKMLVEKDEIITSLRKELLARQ